MFKQRQLAKLPNQRDGLSLLPTPVAGVAFDLGPVLPQRMRFRLSALSVSVLAANDYGSVKLCDLPASNLQVLGAVVELTSTQSGFASNNGSAATLALGSAATASTDFSGTGEKKYAGAISGTGTSTGSFKGSSGESSVAILQLPAGAKSVYVNIADPVTSGTGTMLLSGTIDLYVVDCGAHS